MRVRRAVNSDCSAITAAYLASWRAGYQDLLPADELEIQAQVRSGRSWDVTLLLVTASVRHPLDPRDGRRTGLRGQASGTLIDAH
jgi:hypothetical protein